MLVAGLAYSQVQVLEPDEVELPEATIGYYDDGNSELARRGTNRTSVQLHKVPSPCATPCWPRRTSRYYDEPGISLTGVLRAAWTNVRGGEISQGGSTITQQYARAQYLTQQRSLAQAEGGAHRDQARPDLQKDQVLKHYLNTIYFGRNAYGIEAAARPTSTGRSRG